MPRQQWQDASGQGVTGAFVEALIAEGCPEFRKTSGQECTGLNWFETQSLPMEAFVVLWVLGTDIVGTAVQRSKIGELHPHVAELIRQSEARHPGLTPNYFVSACGTHEVLDWLGVPWSLVNAKGGLS